MVWHNHMCTFAYAQIACVYAFVFQIGNFAQHYTWIYYYPVADYTCFTRIQNPGWNQTQFEFFVAYYYCMTCIVTALIAHNGGSLFC